MATSHIDYRKIDYDQLIDKPIIRTTANVNELTSAGVYDKGDGKRIIVTVDGNNVTQVIEEKNGYQERTSINGGSSWGTWDTVVFSDSNDKWDKVIISDTAPSEPVATTAWINITDDSFNVYDGSDWITIAGGTAAEVPYIPTFEGIMDGTTKNFTNDRIEAGDGIILVGTTSGHPAGIWEYNVNVGGFTINSTESERLVKFKYLIVKADGIAMYFPAENTTYDNTESGLNADNVQDAIDELAELASHGSQVDTMPTASSENEGKIVQYVGDTNQYYTNAYFYKCVEDPEHPGQYIWQNIETQESDVAADEVSYDNTTSGLTATNVQDAIDEIAPETITVDDYSAVQGPCEDGFHIPSAGECDDLMSIMTTLNLTNCNDYTTKLHIPLAGYRTAIYYNPVSIQWQGNVSVFWTYSPKYNVGHTVGDNEAIGFRIFDDNQIDLYNQARSFGNSIRAFKNEYEEPTASWTVVAGSLGSAGIFYNATLGLISLTNGTDKNITIKDKNEGATIVYNDGDTLTQDNMGNHFQRGNNYGFPSTGTISNTSGTQVDTSSYGPNTYSSDVFIIEPDSAHVNQDWSDPHNDNLWGGVTGVQHITIKGYDSQNIVYDNSTSIFNSNNVQDVLDEISDKIENLDDEKTINIGNGDYSIAGPEIAEWLNNGGYNKDEDKFKSKISILTNKRVWILHFAEFNTEQTTFSVYFSSHYSDSYNRNSYTDTGYKNLKYDFTYSNGVYTYNAVASNYWSQTAYRYLRTDVNYSVPYIPTYDGSPATKKYVDQSSIGFNVVSYDEQNVEYDREFYATDNGKIYQYVGETNPYHIKGDFYQLQISGSSFILRHINQPAQLDNIPVDSQGKLMLTQDHVNSIFQYVGNDVTIDGTKFKKGYFYIVTNPSGHDLVYQQVDVQPNGLSKNYSLDLTDGVDLKITLPSKNAMYTLTINTNSPTEYNCIVSTTNYSSMGEMGIEIEGLSNSSVRAYYTISSSGNVLYLTNLYASSFDSMSGIISLISNSITQTEFDNITIENFDGDIELPIDATEINLNPTSGGEDIIYVTQAEYDLVPAADKADPTKHYAVYEEGVAPTPGGGTVIEKGDMLLTSIGGASEDEKYLGKGSGTVWKIVTKEGIYKTSFSCQLFVIQDGYVYYGYDNTFHKINISTGVDETVTVYTGGGYLDNKKRADGYMYFSNSSVCKKVSSDNLTVTDSTITDYNAIPSGLYYKGLYYSQDGNDYVAVDPTGTEVKRYSEVGTINGIYNDKLYRNVGANEASTLAYAIATI